MVYEDRRMTCAMLHGRVSALADAFLKLGLGRGDIVAILLYNCPEFYETAFAANRIGAVFLPLNYRLAGEEFAYILDHSGAKAIVTEAEFHAVIGGIRDKIPGVRHFISLEDTVPEGWVPYRQLVEGSLGADVPDAEVELDDLHRLMYTSGTTDRFKGVMITYGNLYWKNIGHVWELDLTPRDVTMIAGPLYHVGAFDLPASGVLHRGGGVVIMRKFDALKLLQIIEKEKPTNIWLAPAMLSMIVQQEKATEFDLASIRFIIAGGERLPEPLLERILTIFPKARFCDAYGLTETVSGDTFVPDGMARAKLGSVGKPVVHLDLQIVDDNDNPVPTGQIGEIVLRGPKVSVGYWKNPEASAKAFRNGWFHTGDLGMLDEDGYLYIVDRKKDLIISGGENISSLEVERVIYEIPEVLEAAVVGIPDPKWGEAVKAFVVVKPGKTLTAEAVQELCRSKLAKFKVPKEVEFIDQLPRNPSGKVLKRILRQIGNPAH